MVAREDGEGDSTTVLPFVPANGSSTGALRQHGRTELGTETLNDSSPLYKMRTMLQRTVNDAVKRVVDVLGATVGLILLSPVMAVISIVLLRSQGRPILFRQERPGLHGKPFTLLKFRTMRAPRATEVWYQTDAERVTRVGRILRSTSLDELPELFNVLVGDMSLVGPRPLLMAYLSQYTPSEARRHEVRPGITGWAVVAGRHTLKFTDRLALDTWYVDHRSLLLDVRIILRTMLQLLRREGVSTVQDFDEIEVPDRFTQSLASGAR